MLFTVDDIKIQIGLPIYQHFTLLSELKKCQLSQGSISDSSTDTSEEIPIDIDIDILNLIKITVNTYNTIGKFDFSELTQINIARLYDVMVYYFDLNHDVHQELLKELSTDINYISKFNEIMDNDKNIEFIVNIIKYRTKYNLECTSYIVELNTYFKSVWASFAKKIRIAFIFDATASMKTYIEKQKKEAKQLYENIYKIFGNIELEIKLIGYRDYTGEKSISEYDVCKSPSEFSDYLDSMDAIGGGDFAEAPELGIHALSESKFFTTDTDCINIAIIIADALPHDFLNTYVPEQTCALHAQMCKEFTTEHGDWATLLVNLAKSYKVSIYGVNLKQADLYMETWMSTISSITGTETQHSIESLNNTLIKDIISWSFERSIAMSKKASLSKDQLSNIISNMNSKNTTILPNEIQRQLTIDFNETTTNSMSQHFEMAIHSCPHFVKNLKTNKHKSYIPYSGGRGGLKRMRTCGDDYDETDTTDDGAKSTSDEETTSSVKKLARVSSCPMPDLKVGLVRTSTIQLNRLSQLESIGEFHE